MPHIVESIFIDRPPEQVWREIEAPENWRHGYIESTETMEAEVTDSNPPRVLEERQEGQTFSRELRYSLSPAPGGTSLQVEDQVRFKGLAKLVAPFVSLGIGRRWETSLDRLKSAVEDGVVAE